MRLLVAFGLNLCHQHRAQVTSTPCVQPPPFLSLRDTLEIILS